MMTFTDDGKEYYYIHRRIENFKERNTALSLFEQQKKQQYSIMKNRYMKNYINSIHNSSIPKNALNRLNDSMEEERIVNEIDSSLLETLNNSISKAIHGYDLEKNLVAAYNSLDKYLNSGDAKQLDKLFHQITTASNLLNSSTGQEELMFLIGGKSDFSKNHDLSKLYGLVKSTVESWEDKSLNISQKRVASILGSLKELTGALAGGSTDKNSLRRYLTNIFSTQIGEYIVSKGVAEGFKGTTKTIRDSLSGAKNIEIESLEDLEKWEKFGSQSKVFKTDNSFKDLSITLESGETIEIDLGLSTKWYKNSNSASGVAIATEKSFMHRISQMLNGTVEHYYAYNALGLVNQDNSLYTALKAAIVARNLDVLMSGLGAGGDFSQFIVINGDFYSMWQIINLVETYNSGQGSSAYSVGSTDPIIVSATGLSKITDLTEEQMNKSDNIYSAYLRSKQQNQIINDLGMSAHFYPQRLKNIIKK